MLGVHLLSKDYDREEFRRYLEKSPFPKEEREGWFWLDKNTHGVKIAYTGSPDILPLYGTNFKNRAIYVSVNKVQPVKLHLFPDARYIWRGDFVELHNDLEKDGNYRQGPDYFTWQENLKKENIDYLFIYAYHQVKHPVFPVEYKWATEHPDIFQESFSNNRIHIYKIIR